MGSKEKFELVLYNYIKSNSKLPKEAKEKKSLYSYYVKKLGDKGLIKKVGYGIYEVIKEVQTSSNFSFQKGHTTMETSKQVQDVRSHAYRFNIKLPFIQNWEKRKDFFKKHNINYKQLPNGELIKVRKHNVYLYDSSIQITFKSKKYFIGSNPDLNNSKAIVEFNKIMRAIERLLMTNIKFGNSYQVQCHHANIKNSLANYYRERGVNKWSIKDSKGEECLLVYNSFNLLELETIHPKTATRDYKVVVEPLMNTLKENPNILAETQNQIKELANFVKIQQELLKSTQEQLLAQTYLINQLMQKLR